MTDKQRQAIRRAIERQTEANTANAETAKAALVRMEIYTREGKVAREYDPNVEALSARA